MKARGILSFVGSLISWIVVFAALAVALFVAVIPKAQHGASLTVLTQSMQPKINPGDMVAVVPQPCAKINVGDIISYHPRPNDPTLITHRVINKQVLGGGENCQFRVKGDNNTSPDKEIITKEMVAGKVQYVIPKLGFVAQGANGQRSWFAPVVAGVLGVYALIMFFRPDKDKKVKNDSPKTEKEVEETSDEE